MTPRSARPCRTYDARRSNASVSRRTRSPLRAPILFACWNRARRDGQTQQFRCAGCGFDEARIRWRVGGWLIVRCLRCRLLRTWPVPTPEELDRLYNEANYHDVRTDRGRAEWAARAAQIVDVLPQGPRTVLDFGAGEGHLVRALRDSGIVAHGVEPSAAARRAAFRHQDIELYATLEDVSVGEFTTITLLHVLEHVTDPVGTLRALRSALKTNGHMFIEVPHAGSADMWHAPTRRRILDPPAHLHHFTPATLRPLVEQAGLSVVATRLFNASPVEAALALRQRRQRAGQGAAQRAAASSRAHPRELAAAGDSSCAESLLAVTRAAFPGRKFQLIVRAGV